MSEFALYSYFRSSSAFRVRIALSLKGIKYEYRPVHLINNGGEQNSPDYKRLNPVGEVPTLIHGNRPISQSIAIIDYLDHVQAEPRLFPVDPYARARVLQVCEIINSGIQPIQNLKVLQELERRCGFDQKKKTEWASHWIHDGFVGLEKFLEATAGTYCFGHQVTAADIYLVPQVFNAYRFNVPLEGFPVINRVHQACMLLAPFKDAAPEVQPDAPQA